MLHDYLIVDVSVDDPSDATSYINSIQEWVSAAYQIRRGEGSDLALDKLIFRLNTDINWHLYEMVIASIENDIISCVRGRFAKPKIYLIYSINFKLILRQLTKCKDTESVENIVRYLQSNELENIALNSSALYHQSGQHLYQLPSGEVSDYYFRVGNIQTEYKTLEKIWFWSLPYIGSLDHIICDTWSISTLAAFFATRLQSYSESQNIIEWHYLSGYIGNDAYLQEEVRDSLVIAKEKGKSPLFLLSASSSGRTHTVVERFVKEIEFSSSGAALLTLYSLSDQQLLGTTLCDLHVLLSELGLSGFKDAAEIDPKGIIYEVNSNTYIPNYFDKRVHQFNVGKADNSHTSTSEKFFVKYAGKKIFSTCRDGKSNHLLSSHRHHAFHIDVEALFESEAFYKSLELAVQSISFEVTEIIYFGRGADLTFSNKIRNIVGHKCKTVELDCFSEIASNASIIESMKEAASGVLFLDSISISGTSRIQQFQIAIRKILEKNDIEAKIHYLIGMARPSTADKLDWLLKFLPQSAPGIKDNLSVSFVESIILPDWDKSECPWCKERSLINRVLYANSNNFTAQVRRYLHKRIESLDSHSGLIDDVFFKRYGSDRFDFEIGSFFFNIMGRNKNKLVYSNADLVCATASAFQYWRDSTTSLPYAKYVVDPIVLFNPNGFNESLLKASILRSLKFNEFHLSSDSEIENARSFFEYVFFSSEIQKEENRAGNFVLGFEVSLYFGEHIERVLSREKVDEIDWDVLKLMIRHKKLPK